MPPSCVRSAAGQYDEQIDAIIRNATRLKDIVENLSDVENFQNGSARVKGGRVSMTRIAEDVVSLFREEAEQRGITLKLDPPSQPYYLHADQVKITIALSNLVKNAVQYTETGGNVNVRVEEDSGYIKVTVTDNGIGIPPRELPRIFDRFYQVETHLTRRYGGMGLGLSVTKAMIELHGGRIWAESEGKGQPVHFPAADEFGRRGLCHRSVPSFRRKDPPGRRIFCSGCKPPRRNRYNIFRI